MQIEQALKRAQLNPDQREKLQAAVKERFDRLSTSSLTDSGRDAVGWLKYKNIRDLIDHSRNAPPKKFFTDLLDATIR